LAQHTLRITNSAGNIFVSGLCTPETANHIFIY
jgi:hypothetical protein